MRKELSAPVIALILACAFVAVGVTGYFLFLRDRKPNMEAIGENMDRAKEKWIRDHPELVQGATAEQYKEASSGGKPTPVQELPAGNTVERLKNQGSAPKAP